MALILVICEEATQNTYDNTHIDPQALLLVILKTSKPHQVGNYIPAKAYGEFERNRYEM